MTPPPKHINFLGTFWGQLITVHLDTAQCKPLNGMEIIMFRIILLYESRFIPTVMGVEEKCHTIATDMVELQRFLSIVHPVRRHYSASHVYNECQWWKWFRSLDTTAGKMR